MELINPLEKNTNIQHFFALSKVARFALVTGALLILGLSFVLLYLLTVSSGNRSEYEVSYTRLFALNIAAAAALLGFLFWLGLRLLKRLRQKRFGSQLLLKLAFIFGLVGFGLRHFGYPMAPLVLGIVLGDLLEKNLRRALILSDGDISPFFTRPISAVVATLIFGTIAWKIWDLRNKKIAKEAS